MAASFWNYQIIIHEDDPRGAWIGLHEVHRLGKKGKPHSWTENAVSFGASIEEGPDELIKSIAMALADSIRRPVLRERNGKLTEDAKAEASVMDDLVTRLRERFAPATRALCVEAADRIEKLERQFDEAINGWRDAIMIAKAGR